MPCSSQIPPCVRGMVSAFVCVLRLGPICCHAGGCRLGGKLAKHYIGFIAIAAGALRIVTLHGWQALYLLTSIFCKSSDSVG